MGEFERRRRRGRIHDAAQENVGGAESTGSTGPETPVTRGPVPAAPMARPLPGVEERDPERGLRGLVGPGSSQVSLSAALRARDAARPTDADLREAEAALTIVRRNWLPREELPVAGPAAGGGYAGSMGNSSDRS